MYIVVAGWQLSPPPLWSGFTIFACLPARRLLFPIQRPSRRFIFAVSRGGPFATYPIGEVGTPRRCVRVPDLRIGLQGGLQHYRFYRLRIPAAFPTPLSTIPTSVLFPIFRFYQRNVLDNIDVALES